MLHTKWAASVYRSQCMKGNHLHDAALHVMEAEEPAGVPRQVDEHLPHLLLRHLIRPTGVRHSILVEAKQ
jgi:hypothetical protein